MQLAIIAAINTIALFALLYCAYALEQAVKLLTGISHLLALSASADTAKPGPPPVPRG